MQRLKFQRLISVLFVLLVNLTISAARPQQPEIGWAVEFDSPKDVAAAKRDLVARHGAPPPSPDLPEIRIENGVLHLGVKDVPGRDPNHYVTLAWGNWGGDRGTQEPTFPAIDIGKFPIIEIRWCVDRAQNFNPSNSYEDLPTYFLFGRLLLADMQPTAGLQAEPGYREAGWRVDKFRFAPDSSLPGPYTPRWLTGMRLECAAWMRKGPAWFEVDYIRVRAFSEEEAQREQVWINRLANYHPPALPVRLKSSFLYGVFGRPMYIGGWEGAFDDLTRRHMNYVLGVGINPEATLPPIPAIPAPYTEPGKLPKYAAALRETARAAELRGINLIVVPPDPTSTQSVQLEREGPEPVKRAVDQLVLSAKDLPSIVGWWIQDEPHPLLLWGVAATKQIYEQRDPQRLAYITFNNPQVARYYERFLTILVTDKHPITINQREPWVIGEWCREINTISRKQHWLNPQAVGGTDWWKSPEGYGVIAYPSVETFRAMMYLALANGVKSFAIYIYWDMMGVGLVDLVGNPTPLMDDATRLGEKWLPIGPLLLDAPPVVEPTLSASKSASAKRGLSVGALGNPQQGPIYLVVLNEDMESPHGGHLTLPDTWIRRDRAAYDLYGMEKVTDAGAKSVGVRTLGPADGRIYLFGTELQFQTAQQKILHNQTDEMLRVQGADRLIAARWGSNLARYDAAVNRVRNLLKTKRPKEALELCRTEAAQQLTSALAQQPDLPSVVLDLDVAKHDLGEANRTIYYGWQLVRAGRDPQVKPFAELCQRYATLRRRYLLGEKTHLKMETAKLNQDIRQLLAALPPNQ